MIPDVGIRREMPFLLRVGDALVGGKLDALLSDRTVVDYKTGAYVPDRHARYELQLQLYAVAVRRLTRRAPPAALVYYVETGEHRAVDVSEDRLDEALSRVETAISQLRSAPLRDLAP
jgi:RecB family exonuclease